jgi:hypothetical protein
VHLGTINTVAQEPPYRLLQLIQNRSGASETPNAIIGMWDGTLAAANAVADWFVCDGTDDTPDMRGYYPKAGTSANVGTTGGQIGHGHSAAGHHHELAHDHAYTQGTPSAGVAVTNLTGTTVSTNAAHHPATNAPSATVQSTDVALTITDVGDDQPPFISPIFLQKGAPTANPNSFWNIVEM